MKKFFIILCMVVTIIVLALCIVKICYNFAVLELDGLFGYVLWCDSDDRNYLEKRYGISGDYNVIVYSNNGSTEHAYKIENFLYGIGEKTEISTNVGEYIEENSNPHEAFFKSIIPYAIVALLSILLINRMINKLAN